MILYGFWDMCNRYKLFRVEVFSEITEELWPVNFKSMILRKIISFHLILLGFILIPCFGFGYEKYYIDNEPVLLYKIINWWHDCISNNCSRFCDRRVKYVNNGTVHIKYNRSNSVLTLKFTEPFADLLIPLKQNDRDFGPSRFKCTWLNKLYLGSPTPDDINNISFLHHEIIFHSVDFRQANLLKKSESNIGIVIEGAIGGLHESKIMLYQTGEISRYCQSTQNNDKHHSPIFLQIINFKTKETLAVYEAVWE